MEEFDVVIVGAGPAGLTAGIYSARNGLKTLVLDEKQAGGSLILIPSVENYPGFPESISGEELAKRMIEQCKKFGAEIREFEGAIDFRVEGEEKIIRTVGGQYRARAVIIASGSRHRKLNVPGEKEFEGKGVIYCALCDGPLFKGLRVLVVGGGNTAAASAIFMSDIASKVYLAHRRDRLRAEEIYAREIKRRGIEVLWNAEVRRILGDTRVRGVVLHNNKTGEDIHLAVDGVLINIGEIPNSEFARASGVNVDGEGYIIVDELQRTNIPGIYSAGDVTSCPVKQIGTAIGQAIIAAAETYKYVRKPYYA